MTPEAQDYAPAEVGQQIYRAYPRTQYDGGGAVVFAETIEKVGPKTVVATRRWGSGRIKRATRAGFDERGAVAYDHSAAWFATPEQAIVDAVTSAQRAIDALLARHERELARLRADRHALDDLAREKGVVTHV